MIEMVSYHLIRNTKTSVVVRTISAHRRKGRHLFLGPGGEMSYLCQKTISTALEKLLL